MLRNQQQTMDTDLSASAYDSALAGVEDAKRLLLKYNDCKRSTSPTPAPEVGECVRIESAVEDDGGKCTAVSRGLHSNTTEEVKIRLNPTDQSGNSMDQAYTCATVRYTSKEILGSVNSGTSKLIVVDSGAAGSDIRKLKISWFKKKADSLDGSSSFKFPSNPVGELPMGGGSGEPWSEDSSRTPPMLRTQIIQHGSSISADDFNFDTSPGNSNSTSTLFLYPSETALPVDIHASAEDIRTLREASRKNSIPSHCSEDSYEGGGFACSVTIIPKKENLKKLYLQLGAIYGDTDYMIEAIDSTGKPISVVAPAVDVTGRANDMFRRVEARIDLSAGNYPLATIDVNGDLCKDFSVSDNANDYRNNPECEP
ncbi:hypothetical protein H6796_01180 [Candidatus Nomurabacteria bacterium]|nr:hypothetical protein [Candidatus Nomurabacteria bacterium]